MRGLRAFVYGLAFGVGLCLGPIIGIEVVAR